MRTRSAFVLITPALAVFAAAVGAQPDPASVAQQFLVDMERLCHERHSLAAVPHKLERRCAMLELNRDAETLIARTPEQRVEIYLTLKQGIQPEAFAALGERYRIEPLMVNFTDYRQGEYQGGGSINLGMFRGSFLEKFKRYSDYDRERQAIMPAYSPDGRSLRPSSREGVEQLMTGCTGYVTLAQFAQLRNDPQVKSVSLSAKVSDGEYQSYLERQTIYTGLPPGIVPTGVFGSLSGPLRTDRKP